MVEKIYDTIRGILYDEFPKDSTGVPSVYDRQITNWFLGDRKIIASPLGVILRGTQSNVKDIGFGLREIEYSIGVTIYSSNDDQETSERVVQESARLAHSILKKHRSIWVCDLCPFCGKFPLTPIHYIDIGVVASAGISTSTTPNSTGIFSLAGTIGQAYFRTSKGLSQAINQVEILSQGLGISANSVFDSTTNTTLNLVLSGGSTHVGYSTTFMLSYANNIVNSLNNYWLETHVSGTPAYYDWAGIAYQSVFAMVEDWKAGIRDANISSNNVWNNVDLVRYLQDIQVGDIKPSDDGVDTNFLHMAEFTLKAKEIISVDQFGPNNVNINAI
jgi:hypothetical protein